MYSEPRVLEWLSALGSEDRAAICTIVRGEIIFGLHRLHPGRRRSELEVKANKLLASMTCEPMPAEVGDMYALIKATQFRAGAPLADNDLWIAAVAASLNATLVTRDKALAAIAGLKTISI